MIGTNIPVSLVLQEFAGDQEAAERIAKSLGVTPYGLQGVLHELAMEISENGMPRELYSVQD